MLHNLTTNHIALVVILVTIVIYPVGLAAQWVLWRAARWISLQIWGDVGTRNVDMAILPDPGWKSRKTENVDS